MFESRWIPLSSETIAPFTHPDDAVWATESPSPYDVPSHVRSSYDSNTGHLTIEFRYIEPESQINIQLNNYAIARVGKRSRRIWALMFDIHGFNRDRKRITDVAVHSIESLSTDDVQNGDIAARAISSKSTSLFDTANFAVSL